MESTNNLRSWVMLLFLSIIWGSSFILIKRGLTGFSPVQVGILRVSVTALAFMPFALFHLRRYKNKNTRYLILSGVLGSALPSMLFPLAQTKLSSGVAGILNSLSPLFALLLGIIWFGQYWKKIWLLGVFLGLAGAIVLIAFQNGVQWDGNIEQYQYAGYAVLATICYGMSVNVVKKYLQDVPSLQISAFSFSLIGVPIWLMIPPAGIPEQLATEPQAWSALGYIALLALAGTALATVVFFRLVQMTNVVFSSSVAYLIPIVALLWGLVDNEPFNAWQLVGMVLILAGVYLTKR